MLQDLLLAQPPTHIPERRVDPRTAVCLRPGTRHMAAGANSARCVFMDPAIVGAGLVREGGRSRAVEALTIVRS